jgi:hypothetical protein
MNKLNELTIRRNVAIMCIKFLNEKCKDDPRYPDALTEYRKQLETIERQITEITGEPPAIVIGLKTAKLFGKSERS